MGPLSGYARPATLVFIHANIGRVILINLYKGERNCCRFFEKRRGLKGSSTCLIAMRHRAITEWELGNLHCQYTLRICHKTRGLGRQVPWTRVHVEILCLTPVGPERFGGSQRLPRDVHRGHGLVVMAITSALHLLGTISQGRRAGRAVSDAHSYAHPLYVACLPRPWRTFTVRSACQACILQ